VIKSGTEFTSEFKPDLLHGVPVLIGEDQNGEPLMAVPYYSWSHRGAGEMAVWMKRQE
jgi:DUF1680 family protein